MTIAARAIKYARSTPGRTASEIARALSTPRAKVGYGTASSALYRAVLLGQLSRRLSHSSRYRSGWWAKKTWRYYGARSA